MIAPSWFLFAGISLSLLGLPRSLALKGRLKTWGTRVLQGSIILLGAKIPIGELLEAGRAGLGVSLVSVILVLTTGWFLSRVIRFADEQVILISSGTAICGGSAIGAVAPVIRAQGIDVGISISVVFLLNAAAMLIFPPIGRWMGLTDHQFAYWAALAIHDTSSVVGAGAQWSEPALQLATTIKLSRTLWIFPLVLLFTFRRPQTLKKAASAPSQNPKGRIAVPWFIVGFLAMSLICSAGFLPGGTHTASWLAQCSVLGFGVSLFLIGSSIAREQLFKAGFRPLLFGVLLWLLTLGGSLAFVLNWIA